MITNLTAPFTVLRKKYVEEKKKHLELFFQFIEKTSVTGGCVLCMGALPAFDKQLNTAELFSIESKLCEECILKTHSRTPSFSLKISTPSQFIDIQRFLDGLCSLGVNQVISGNKMQIRKTSIEELNAELEKVVENDNYNNAPNNPFYGYIKNYKIMLRRFNIKRLIKMQIRSKVQVIEEQLKTLERNHAEAILAGKFQDSDAFKELYYLLFQTKIKLEESLFQ
ncbi:hypothetical protein GINT2_002083 [Glugoides intestinalis]